MEKRPLSPKFRSILSGRVDTSNIIWTDIDNRNRRSSQNIPANTLSADKSEVICKSACAKSSSASNLGSVKCKSGLIKRGDKPKKNTKQTVGLSQAVVSLGKDKKVIEKLLQEQGTTVIVKKSVSPNKLKKLSIKLRHTDMDVSCTRSKRRSSEAETNINNTSPRCSPRIKKRMILKSQGKDTSPRANDEFEWTKVVPESKDGHKADKNISRDKRDKSPKRAITPVLSKFEKEFNFKVTPQQRLTAEGLMKERKKHNSNLNILKQTKIAIHTKDEEETTETKLSGKSKVMTQKKETETSTNIGKPNEHAEVFAAQRRLKFCDDAESSSVDGESENVTNDGEKERLSSLIARVEAVVGNQGDTKDTDEDETDSYCSEESQEKSENTSDILGKDETSSDFVQGDYAIKQDLMNETEESNLPTISSVEEVILLNELETMDDKVIEKLNTEIERDTVETAQEYSSGRSLFSDLNCNIKKYDIESSVKIQKEPENTDKHNVSERDTVSLCSKATGRRYEDEMYGVEAVEGKKMLEMLLMKSAKSPAQDEPVLNRSSDSGQVTKNKISGNPHKIFEKSPTEGQKKSAFFSEELEQYLEENSDIQLISKDSSNKKSPPTKYTGSASAATSTVNKLQADHAKPDMDDIDGKIFLSFFSKSDLQYHVEHVEMVAKDGYEGSPGKTDDVTKVKGWRKRFDSASSETTNMPLKNSSDLVRKLNPYEIQQLGFTLKKKKKKLKKDTHLHSRSDEAKEDLKLRYIFKEHAFP